MYRIQQKLERPIVLLLTKAFLNTEAIIQETPLERLESKLGLSIRGHIKNLISQATIIADNKKEISYEILHNKTKTYKYAIFSILIDTIKISFTIHHQRQNHEPKKGLYIKKLIQSDSTIRCDRGLTLDLFPEEDSKIKPLYDIYAQIIYTGDKLLESIRIGIPFIDSTGKIASKFNNSVLLNIPQAAFQLEQEVKIEDAFYSFKEDNETNEELQDYIQPLKELNKGLFDVINELK